MNVLFHVFLFVVKVLPAWIYFPLSKLGVRLFYHIHPRAKKYACETLTVAFGDTLSPAERARLARRSFLSLGDGIAGFIYTIGRPWITERLFDIEGESHLKEALAKGKGVVVGIAHFGPFVWMLMRFIAAGYGVNVVARPPRGKFWEKTFRSARKYQSQFNVILSVPMRQCVTESLALLKRNEIVFMPVDQNYGANGRIFVPFFGRLAATAPGPAIFSARSGAPLLMAFAVPAGTGRFRIIIEKLVPLAATGDERRDLTANTRYFTAVVEKYIRDHADQWSWIHRRWKTTPKEGEAL